MPLARTFDAARGAVVTTLRDAFEDRLSRDSDIREYLPLLYDTARAYPQVRVLELGTRQGNSTLAFLAAAEEAGGHAWSCDIAPVNLDLEGMAPWARHPRWTFVHGDDMHPSVRAKLPAEVDVLFIDTSHEHQHTLDELRAYMPRLAPGGVALLHDTNVYDWPGYGWTGDVPPVQQALNEYCAAAGMSWEELPGRYGMGIIRRDSEPAAS